MFLLILPALASSYVAQWGGTDGDDSTTQAQADCFTAYVPVTITRAELYIRKVDSDADATFGIYIWVEGRGEDYELHAGETAEQPGAGTVG